MEKTKFQINKKEPEIHVNKPPERSFWQRQGPFNVWYFVIMLLFLYMFQSAMEVKREEIPYSQFMGYLQSGQIAECVIKENMIAGTLKLMDQKTGKPRRFITVRLRDDQLAKALAEKGVKYSAAVESHFLSNLIFSWIIPFAIIFLLWGYLGKKMGGMGMNFMNIGKNKAHIHAETDHNITFEDVAGADEAKQELQEVIEFLRNPDRFQRLGGRMPKGVLLAGPPGTGKTLLARAVSGEAGAPFFNISGSDFIEMFVGVGAARVRDLFEQARKKAPCIIFIDELDAIGRQRGGPVVMGGHDEREQTLNQLLVEMDGFDSSNGVVVLSATNRPEVLDKALLRPGRFDRQIVVDKPDLRGRVEILKIHTKDLTMAPDVDLEIVARRTPGFVGADLANVANEAAILAARKGRDAVTTQDFEAAIDRVIAGPEKKKSTLSPEEKHRVSYHESGHALVAELVPGGEPVHKVSIIPRGIGALGYTLQVPEKEKFLATRNELLDQIAVLLGGRVAEEVVFGDVSTGAQNDLERSSELARSMVCSYGMSEQLGALTFGKKQASLFLSTEYGEEKNYSEETARQIDAEVREIVQESYERVRILLKDNRPVLDALAARLEEKEVLSGEEVKAVVEKG
ncbi:MAG: ATP-dependent zinc metalloprotease FtsH [Deltaproteobacteria bacterium]|nr:ATP-dependent zinc metalloprotease FtsH [Deltaproteobacteria bacterium]MBW2049803.1 ATP-dependent zinc metalloprotease FtsH [Deltaproteobacteria bacterium]MBW2111806.1 ATP-dependent zinc metalloprotease FtsH [Deltaproteobacteria bacterium]MBW2353562.1 ATP-dependent zinc metalloprotease FtsH [Deltaproteobacteria bacterium]